jgi:hypothetical protein
MGRTESLLYVNDVPPPRLGISEAHHARQTRRTVKLLATEGWRRAVHLLRKMVWGRRQELHSNRSLAHA